MWLSRKLGISDVFNQSEDRPGLSACWLPLLVATIVGLWLYSPALRGPFVFDDRTLPYASPAAADVPFVAWLGVRPVLMFVYWLNYHASPDSTFLYHLVNVFLHVINA